MILPVCLIRSYLLPPCVKGIISYRVIVMFHKKSIAKSTIVIFMSLATMAITATLARAETIEGRLNGLGCASEGHFCPIDMLDMHVSLEGDFILQTTDGKYYFINNLDRAIKARHLLQTVRVEGKLNPEFNAIEASELWVKIKGEYILVWSSLMQDEQQRLFYRKPDVH